MRARCYLEENCRIESLKRDRESVRRKGVLLFVVEKAAAEVSSRYGRLDMLINNAGINYDTWETVKNADTGGTVLETITTNR